MVVKSLLEDYYDWILSEIDFDLPEHRNYEKLLRKLYMTEFRWVLDKDENRDADAFELRREYLFDEGYKRYDIWNTPRSVLEVLVAFSRRIEIEIMGEPGNDDLDRWFWIMLENLGLLKYTDERYNDKKVNEILDIWMSRNFRSDGKGSIYPLKNVKSDQRETEMWYQMHAYLIENYPI